MNDKLAKISSHQDGGKAVTHLVSESGKENQNSTQNPDDRKIGKVHQGK